jgi:3-deoxy-7-phosphoheptulonate synthase
MPNSGKDTQNLRVLEFTPLPTPAEVIGQFSPNETAAQTVIQGRQEFRDAIAGKDKRHIVIAGPCSIHDPKAGIEYAHNLAQLRKKISDKIIVVMRVYFEKPRTTVGWKGLINDPHLDGTYDVLSGLKQAREILLKINELGLPCATEFLDPIVPQYTSDLVTWAAIGARTTESQTHRQMASGLSMPVGFKNATNGSLQIAIDAMVSAQSSHAFVGINQDGQTSIINTSGNPDVHVVLRGSKGKPNYKKPDIAYTKVMLEPHTGIRTIMIDCSHGNSSKDYRRQPEVFREVISQVVDGETSILGTMLESNLEPGNQKLSSDLKYGVSVTDGCIDWNQTEEILLEAHKLL